MWDDHRLDKRFLVGLALVTVLAAILRLWAIDFGLPLITHPDEPLIYGPAERMVSERTLNPEWFRYPAFIINTQAGVIAAVRVIDRSIGLSDGSAITLAYSAGRLIMASLGIATVWLTGLIGRSLAFHLSWNRSERRDQVASLAGIVSALILAVSYIHVKDSHFLKPDVPTGFFVTLALWLTIRASDRGASARKHWLLAATAVGLAASAKYTGGVIAIAPATALGLSVWRLGDRSDAARLFVQRAIEMSVVVVAVFLLINPYVVITPRVFLSLDYGIRAEMEHYRTGHDGAEGRDTWRWYLEEIWRNGFGPTLTPIVLIGLGVMALALFRARREGGMFQAIQALAPILVFTVVYYLSIAPYPVRFDRQLIPILPSLAIIAGLAVLPLGRLIQNMQPKNTRTAIVTVTLILTIAVTPSLVRGADWGITAARTDTRYAALDWLNANVEPGTVVAREWHTPPVSQDGFADIFVRKVNDHPSDWYRDWGVEYVILSSFMYQRYLDAPDTYPEDAAFYQDLLRRPREATFSGQNGPVIVILRMESVAAAMDSNP